jgi:hypothetical protein
LAEVASGLKNSGMSAERAIAEVDKLADPATMLVDVNPNLLQQGQRIVAKGGGPGRTTITNRVADRAEATPARVKADVTATLGTAMSPTEFETGMKRVKGAISPEYEKALQDPGVRPVDAQAIDQGIQSALAETVGETNAKLQKIAGYLRDNKGTLDTSPRRALAVRNEIDDMLEATDLPSRAKKKLTEVRQQVDQELGVAVPGIKAVDAKFEKVAQKGQAFEEGQKLLQKGSKWPTDIKTDIAQKGGHWAEGLQEGTRTQIEDIIGNAGYNATGLKQAIKGDGTFNRDKLEILFGKDKADAIGQILKREQTYQRSHVRLTEQSPTAERAPQISPTEYAGLLKDVPLAAAINPKYAAAVLVKNIGKAAIDKVLQNRAIARDAEVANLLTSNEPTTVLRGIQLAQQRGAMLPQTMVNALLERQFNKGQ